jgi:hypothetical protein
MGPVAVTLRQVIAEGGKCWWRKKPRTMALLNPLPDFPMGPVTRPTGPFAGGTLPKKIEVGDEFTTYLIPDHEGLAKNDFDRVGFSDTFSRMHWCSRRDLVVARTHIREACDKAGKKHDA